VRVSPADPPTFDEFAAAELPRLLGLARALTRNPHDAGDLVNDTLAKASLRWKSIERGSNPAAYVRTMMVRLNLDRLRRLRRGWLSSEPPERAHEDVLPIGVEPWLATAMAALTDRQRTAVTMRSLCGSSTTSTSPPTGQSKWCRRGSTTEVRGGSVPQ
jgi:DNA-directed RNA polymerase specialized sigma24 family protein